MISRMVYAVTYETYPANWEIVGVFADRGGAEALSQDDPECYFIHEVTFHD